MQSLCTRSSTQLRWWWNMAVELIVAERLPEVRGAAGHQPWPNRLSVAAFHVLSIDSIESS